jgi:NADH dehydrogenase FAD-containing subunit
LTDFLLRDVAKVYPHLSNLWEVHLVEGGPKLLAPFQEDSISAHAKEHLENNQKVKVHTNAIAETVTDSSITFKDGKTINFSKLLNEYLKPIIFV